MGFPYTFPFKFKEFTRILMVRTEIKENHGMKMNCNTNHIVKSNFKSNHCIGSVIFENHWMAMNTQSNHFMQSSFLGGGE